MITLGFCIYVVVCGGLTAFVANSKGRDGVAWFIIGAVFGVLGLIAAAGAGGQRNVGLAQAAGHRQEGNRQSGRREAGVEGHAGIVPSTRTGRVTGCRRGQPGPFGQHTLPGEKGLKLASL